MLSGQIADAPILGYGLDTLHFDYEGESLSIVAMLLKRRDFKSLEQVLTRTYCNLDDCQCPIIDTMLTDEALFELLYEKLSVRFASESLFHALYESAVQQASTPFLTRLFRSQPSHQLFSCLSSESKALFIEQLLLYRGELQQLDAEHLPSTFAAVYSELALQPYAPAFFQTFQQVINSAGDEDPGLLHILNIARDQLTDEDYRTFLWEQPDLALELLVNFVRFGDSVTASIDRVVLPFLMKLRQTAQGLEEYCK